MGIQYAPARARRWLDEYADVVDVIAGRLRLDELARERKWNSVPYDSAGRLLLKNLVGAAGFFSFR